MSQIEIISEAAPISEAVPMIDVASIDSFDEAASMMGQKRGSLSKPQ